jgi:hypothetical protein
MQDPVVYDRTMRAGMARPQVELADSSLLRWFPQYTMISGDQMLYQHTTLAKQNALTTS